MRARAFAARCRECFFARPHRRLSLGLPGGVRRPNNILEWHFVIIGPADTPYTNGQYHGKLLFPSEYPYKPPAIMMLTPK